ncbi:unnamed protein product [Sympodiomycopsis kandeliae]
MATALAEEPPVGSSSDRGHEDEFWPFNDNKGESVQVDQMGDQQDDYRSFQLPDDTQSGANANNSDANNQETVMNDTVMADGDATMDVSSQLDHLGNMSEEQRVGYYAMLNEAATSVVPSTANSPLPSNMGMGDIDMDQVQAAIAGAADTVRLEMENEDTNEQSEVPRVSESNDHQQDQSHGPEQNEVPTEDGAEKSELPTEEQQDGAENGELSTEEHQNDGEDHGNAQQDDSADVEHRGETSDQQGHTAQSPSYDTEQPADEAPSSPPPDFDMAQFGESSLEAIAAAQIAAGLGDFDFSAPEALESQEQEDEGHPASAADRSSPSAESRGTKRRREDEDGDGGSSNMDAGDLLAHFTTVSEPQPGNEADEEPITQSSIDAMTAAATAAVAGQDNNQSSTAPMPAPPMQKAFGQFTFKPTTTEDAFQRYAPARPQAQSQAPSQPASSPGPAGSAPSPRPSAPGPAPPPATASINRPAPPPVSVRPTPSTPSTSSTTGPRPPMPFPRPPPPPAPTPTEGPTVKAMPRPMPRPGAAPRPPPASRPAARPPPNTGARPAAPPALPASALFSGGGASGSPSFAALLGTLGPKDLAMVAHAAMGLDAEGNPLPGNEESHRALADAMKRLRESTMQPPPPPPQSTASNQQQKKDNPAKPTQQPAKTSAKANKKDTDKSSEKTASKTSKSSSKPNGSPARDRSLPPDTVQRVLDALPRTTGDPLQDKQPLIAGPKPDRAPPKPGPPPEKRFQCPKCDRAFARAYNLNTHLSTHDPDPHRSKPFPCPYPACRTEKRSFSRKHDLQRHIASTHESEPEPEPITAEEDEGQHQVPSSLAKLGLGAPGRKFRCECGRAFVRRDALRRHNCEAMKAKWPEYAHLNNASNSTRRSGRVSANSPMDDDAAFDAIAASFAAAAEEEMRAAQEHHAARAAGDDDEDDDERDEGGEQEAGAAQTEKDKASTTQSAADAQPKAVEGGEKENAVAQASNKDSAEEATESTDQQEDTLTHSDDALAQLASQLTADAALGMGLDFSGLGGESEQNSAQATTETGNVPPAESPSEPMDTQEAPAPQSASVAPEASSEPSKETEQPTSSANEAEPSTDASKPSEVEQQPASENAPEQGETDAANPNEQEASADPAGAEATAESITEQTATEALTAGNVTEQTNTEGVTTTDANGEEEDYSEQQVNDAAAQFMAQLQGQLGDGSMDDEDGGQPFGENLMGDVLSGFGESTEEQPEESNLVQDPQDQPADGGQQTGESDQTHTAAVDNQQAETGAEAGAETGADSQPSKLIPKEEPTEDGDGDGDRSGLEGLTSDTSITAQ